MLTRAGISATCFCEAAVTKKRLQELRLASEADAEFSRNSSTFIWEIYSNDPDG